MTIRMLSKNKLLYSQHKHYLKSICPQHGFHSTESRVEDANEADQWDRDVHVKSSDLSQGKGRGIHNDGHVEAHL